MKLFHSHSPLRIFAFSTISTLAILLAVLFGLGWSALLTTLILVVIEITFSFENAIINAKVLTTMSRFWQNMFLSVGIIIAVFGMRIIFPIAVVAIATGLSWQSVLDLSLNNPDEYSAQLEAAYPSISAFGGAFLLMLAGSFFFDPSRKVLWFKKPERLLQKFSSRWTAAMLTAGVLGVVALLGSHTKDTLTAGAVGIVTFMAIHGLSEFFGKLQSSSNKSKIVQKTGFAAFMTFMYLELLDASFSLDGVIGAFAITDQVLLIAAGLGAGALWVRSMTVFIVRKGTLQRYKYIDHGAHYTVLVLAFILLLSGIVHIPEAFAGVAGIILIVSSIVMSGKGNVQKA